MSNANVNPDEAAAATSLATLSTLNGAMLTTTKIKQATTTTPFSKPNKPKKNATAATKGKRGAMVDRIYNLYNLFFILERGKWKRCPVRVLCVVSLSHLVLLLLRPLSTFSTQRLSSERWEIATQSQLPQTESSTKATTILLQPSLLFHHDINH